MGVALGLLAAVLVRKLPLRQRPRHTAPAAHPAGIKPPASSSRAAPTWATLPRHSISVVVISTGQQLFRLAQLCAGRSGLLIIIGLNSPSNASQPLLIDREPGLRLIMQDRLFAFMHHCRSHAY
jgi:hypothetical protein